jgi:hypothetical protein
MLLEAAMSNGEATGWIEDIRIADDGNIEVLERKPARSCDPKESKWEVHLRIKTLGRDAYEGKNSFAEAVRVVDANGQEVYRFKCSDIHKLYGDH